MKILRTKKGITLIALVITIIVLLILAGVSISAITGENGIATKAKAAKEKTIAAEEKEFVNIAYSAASIDSLGADVTVEKMQEELDKSVGIGKTLVKDNNDGTLNIIFNDTNNTYTVKSAKKEVYKGLTITSTTEDVQYMDKDGNAKELTDDVEDGDIVIYGDYKYVYNYYSVYDYYFETVSWTSFPEQNGWGVAVNSDRKKKEEYGELCGNILGKNVVNMTWAFGNCISLIRTIKIPDTVVYMDSAFWNCQLMQKGPNIPSKVIELETTFCYCNSMTEIYIPSSVKTITGWAFRGCYNLTSIIIPESVENIGSSVFENCTSLETINIRKEENSIENSPWGAPETTVLNWNYTE